MVGKNTGGYWSGVWLNFGFTLLVNKKINNRRYECANQYHNPASIWENKPTYRANHDYSYQNLRCSFHELDYTLKRLEGRDSNPW
jgi:hypothetical protein